MEKKARELERKEEKKTQYQTQLHDSEVAYKIDKKMTKQGYEEVKADLEKSYTGVDEEIEIFVSDLTENL